MGLELKMNTNRWTNEKNELGYPKISKEFRVGQVLL
jgi:hypothetical protein